jgi:hypothetical protein
VGWGLSNALSSCATGGLSYTGVPSYESLNSSTMDVGKPGAGGRLPCVAMFVLKRRLVDFGIRSSRCDTFHEITPALPSRQSALGMANH